VLEKKNLLFTVRDSLKRSLSIWYKKNGFFSWNPVYRTGSKKWAKEKANFSFAHFPLRKSLLKAEYLGVPQAFLMHWL
jgi:hypothetical protein